MADRDPAVVGARIARRRQQLGWTQIELAGRLGVSPSTVANWERGASYPKKKLGLVEYVLGVSVADPEPLRRELTKAELNALHTLVPEEADRVAEFIRLIRSPDKADQDRLMELIRRVRSGGLPQREGPGERQNGEGLAG